MRKSQIHKLTILAIALAVPTSLFADYSYQQTTQITGGSIMAMMKMVGAFSSQARKAGEPITSSIYIKGNRMANVAPDHIEIIDLDAETITNIDTAKRTYVVMTFQQIRDQLAQAQQQMQKAQAEHPAPTAPDATKPDDVKVTYDVHVRNTGVEKQISGLDTKEAIMTLMMIGTDQKTQQTGAMAITNDMWLVPEIPGYKQVREFYMRMAEKMGVMSSGVGVDMTKMLAQNPGATQALTDMGKEMQKIQGVPIMQIMRMGATTDGKPLPAASEAPLPPSPSGPAMPSGGDIAKQSAASMISSHLGGLGGLGGFGKKKKADPPPPDPNANQAPPTSSVLMESQTTITNFSSDPVDPSHFAIPAGYKQVQPQMGKPGAPQ